MPHFGEQVTLTCALVLCLLEPRYSLPLEQHAGVRPVEVCALWLHPSVCELWQVCLHALCLQRFEEYAGAGSPKPFLYFIFCPVSRPAGCTRKTGCDRFHFP